MHPRHTQHTGLHHPHHGRCTEGVLDEPEGFQTSPQCTVIVLITCFIITSCLLYPAYLLIKTPLHHLGRKVIESVVIFDIHNLWSLVKLEVRRQL